jgi:hypothetical protein
MNSMMGKHRLEFIDFECYSELPHKPLQKRLIRNQIESISVLLKLIWKLYAIQFTAFLRNDFFCFLNVFLRSVYLMSRVF